MHIYYTYVSCLTLDDSRCWSLQYANIIPYRYVSLHAVDVHHVTTNSGRDEEQSSRKSWRRRGNRKTRATRSIKLLFFFPYEKVTIIMIGETALLDYIGR